MSTLHIKQFQREIAITYAARTNLLAISKPGIGKTETAIAACEALAAKVNTPDTPKGEEFRHWFFDMATATPNDLMAYMPNEATHQLECYENAGLPNAYRTPNAKGVVVMDEALNGDPTTVKVFQKFNNGEDIGGRLRKPDGVICLLLSNRMGDKAGVMQQSRAFLRRVETLEIYSDPAHNLKFAESAGWWPALIDFLKKFPHLIDNYDDVFDLETQKEKQAKQDEVAERGEEGKRGVWANMASWTRISKLEYAAAGLRAEMNPCRFLSNVGRGPGLQYQTYRSTFDKIASVDEIIKDPKAIAIPKDMSHVFVMVNLLAELVPQANIKQASIFIDRLQGDLRSLAIRRLVKRAQRKDSDFDIGSTKEFAKWIQDPSIQDMFGGGR